MSNNYSQEVLKVVVAKICQTIGWHSIQTTPLEIMVDILRRYLSELTKVTHSYATLFGHTQPNLDELGLAFRDMHINIADLEEYVRYVDSSPAIEAPKFPVPKESHLNFLKPGSSEVVTRPVHIHEHLPPMFKIADEAEVSTPQIKQEEEQISPKTDNNQSTPVFKRPADLSPNENAVKRPRLIMEEEGRPTREISSVMMTTSGFLSPAREGKLPEARTPINPIDTPSTSTAHPSTVVNPEPRFERKVPKVMRDVKKVDKRKDRANKELNKLFVDEVATKKFGTMKDVARMKAMKGNMGNNSSNNNSVTITPELTVSKVSNTKSPGKQLTKAQMKQAKNDKQFLPTTTSAAQKSSSMPDKVMDGKLSSEPDKSKLNIFKKISKIKEDKIEKNDKGKSKEEPVTLESRESSPDLIIDESDMKHNSWDQKSSLNKQPEITIKVETIEKPSKSIPYTDNNAKMYDVAKNSPRSEKDFLYDDDMSPPGTPSTPKTPEMPTHSPPQKVEKETKRKRKEKANKETKTRNKNKMPRYSMSPRRNKNDSFEGELERPKTPNDPVNLVIKEEGGLHQLMQPMNPVFPFFSGLIPSGPGLIPGGPGLIPPQLQNSLFPGLPLAGGLPKHGFGQPAHIPPAMPGLPFPPQMKQSSAINDEIFDDKPSISTLPETPKQIKEEPVSGPSKEKHKKDKKDKPKKKNKKDKIKNKSEKKKLKEEKKEKDKEKAKKEKREKKKEKERDQHDGSVPKLTLKIGSPRPPTPDVQPARKLMIKPVIKKDDEPVASTSTSNSTEHQEKREPSPELARFSALITRPPKPKTAKETHGKEEVSTSQTNTSTSPKQCGPLPGRSRMNSTPKPGPPTSNATSSAGGKAPGKQKAVLNKRQASSVVDEEGNKIWICPGCGGHDDGSPMIGCDDCDAWYHWVCVGIQIPPDDNEDWYCRLCLAKTQESLQLDKKKKRKKRERKEH